MMTDNNLIYQSTKTYAHSVGLSCCFRQWRAESHCHFLHGYALKVTLTFETEELDIRNWAVDFGSLKSLKGWLEDTFDHKLLIAEDDPERETLEDLAELGIADIRVLPDLGMERFAEAIWIYADMWLGDNGYKPRCKLRSVEVWEHEGNSAKVTLKD